MGSYPHQAESCPKPHPQPLPPSLCSVRNLAPGHWHQGIERDCVASSVRWHLTTNAGHRIGPPSDCSHPRSRTANRGPSSRNPPSHHHRKIGTETPQLRAPRAGSQLPPALYYRRASSRFPYYPRLSHETPHANGRKRKEKKTNRYRIRRATAPTAIESRKSASVTEIGNPRQASRAWKLGKAVAMALRRRHTTTPNRSFVHPFFFYITLGFFQPCLLIAITQWKGHAR